MDLNLIW